MIGEQMRKMRTIKEYSQDYVSYLLNISQAAYSDIENSKTKINLIRVQRIATIFKLNINDLISFDENHLFSNAFSENSSRFLIAKKVYPVTFVKE